MNLPRFCAEQRVSPFMVLAAGVFGLLHRYSGDEDIIAGMPAANRERMDLEDQIGLYLNTLALRVRVERGVTLSELLDRVRAAVLQAQEHQGYPFDALIQELKPKRSTDRNPLFDVMVMMEDAVRPEFRAPGIRGSEYAVPMGVSVFDLTFHFSRSDAGIRLDLEYNTGLFGRPRAERLASHLDRVIEAIVASPGAKLEDVDILTGEERRRIAEFSEGPVLPAPAETVIEMFAAQAIRDPGRTAVVFEQRSLSYGDLAAASARLASRIRRSGMGAGPVVALVAERSEWMVAGLIGIMASGAACLPIDAAQPQARIARILEDSGCQAVVSDGVVTAAGARPVMTIREGGEAGAQMDSRARLSEVAYITYTSGSTGAPKGSPIEHRSLANLVSALGRSIYDALPPAAGELLLTSIGFDVAMKQIFGALTRGNTLVVAGERMRHDPGALMAAVAAGGIHLMDVTPAHFAVLLAQGFARMPKPSLRAIVLGSEPLACGLLEEFARDEANRHIALYNFYGPSECTVETLFCRLDETSLAGSGTAPIGRPLANTRAYVLSPGLGPVPIGIPGEICLGGAAVGRGYLNRPELSAAKFVDDPFHPGERMYRTGDLGRWRADGQMEFLGREDGQLKVRGYRIEPGEVEHCLLQHPQVTGAVAGGRQSPAGSRELVAWYTAAEPIPDADALRVHLRRFLPHYMVPARLAALPEFPLQASGKIDQDALPDPWTVRAAAPRHDPPEDGLEAELQAIWQRVLGGESPGVDVEFFDAGGSSLLLAGLHSQIDQRHPGKIRLMELFAAASVREQARLIRQRANGGPRPGHGREYLVRLGGSGSRTLFCFAAGSGSCHGYYELARRLSKWRVYGVDFIETQRPAAAMADLLVEAQPEGGYLLLGYSMGGNMAYETARELESRGRHVSGLVFLDAWRRLERFHFTDEEYRKHAQEFLTTVDARFFALHNREAMVRRVESYDRYMDSRMEDRWVACPIRLVQAESHEVRCGFRITQQGWGDLTADFQMTAGAGRHLQMLEEPHVTRNAAIVDSLLEELVPADVRMAG